MDGLRARMTADEKSHYFTGIPGNPDPGLYPTHKKTGKEVYKEGNYRPVKTRKLSFSVCPSGLGCLRGGNGKFVAGTGYRDGDWVEWCCERCYEIYHNNEKGDCI